jgi:hypothetical protein
MLDFLRDFLIGGAIAFVGSMMVFNGVLGALVVFWKHHGKEIKYPKMIFKGRADDLTEAIEPGAVEKFTSYEFEGYDDDEDDTEPEDAAFFPEPTAREFDEFERRSTEKYGIVQRFKKALKAFNE